MRMPRAMNGEVERAIDNGTPGLYYLTGDATDPYCPHAPCVIAHVVNDIGAWGKGFVTALDRLSPLPRMFYKHWQSGAGPRPGELRSGAFTLGAAQIVTGFTPPVASLCAQRGIRPSGIGHPPIRYDALRQALCALEQLLSQLDQDDRGYHFQVHMPRIGAGLAGGDWSLIAPIISDVLKARCVAVYDLPPAPVKDPCAGSRGRAKT